MVLCRKWTYGFARNNLIGSAKSVRTTFAANSGKPLMSATSTNDASNDSATCDLWVVGAGTLGEIVCRLYKQRHPQARVVAETATNTRHARLVAEYDVTCHLRGDRSNKDEGTARNVVITIPPSSSTDYTEEITEATKLWAGPSGGGRLVFTSSTAAYGESDGKVVTEDSQVDTKSVRSAK